MFKLLFKSYLINSLVDVYDFLYTHPELKKNIYLKEKYNNKRVFILGSGSSILLYNLKIPEPENCCILIKGNIFFKGGGVG